MLPLLGAVLAAYATWSIGCGQVYARDGWWGCNVRRDDRPGTFWSAVACWFALAALLLFLP